MNDTNNMTREQIEAKIKEKTDLANDCKAEAEECVVRGMELAKELIDYELEIHRLNRALRELQALPTGDAA